MPPSINFSVVVPTRDRPSQLQACLNALAGMNYPRSRFEVIVVDDGSKQRLDSVISPFLDRMDLVLLRQSPTGPAAARNAGAGIARGRFLAFTDDDCSPAPDWLDELECCLDGSGSDAAGGLTLNAIPDNLCSSASQLLVTYLYEYFNHDRNRARFLASCNFTISADCYGALGGFDAAYPKAAAEDRDICDRLVLAGCNLVYTPWAIVYHRHPLTLFSFLVQHLRYGRGAFQFRRAHAERAAASVQIEPWVFYAGLMRAPIDHKEVHRPLFVAALIVFTQIANLAGFLLEWGRTGLLRVRRYADRSQPSEIEGPAEPGT